jgi:hypothetical protein
VKVDQNQDYFSGVGSKYVGRAWTFVLALLNVVLASALLVSLLALWPGSLSATSSAPLTHVLLGIQVRMSPDTNVMVIAAIAGALGGVLHSLRSMAAYIGSRQFKWSWSFYYLSLPIVAAILALIFYFVVRGGLVSPQGVTGDINPYGIAAISGLVGLFTGQAAGMLQKIFEAIFSSSPTGVDPLKK